MDEIFAEREIIKLHNHFLKSEAYTAISIDSFRTQTPNQTIRALTEGDRIREGKERRMHENQTDLLRWKYDGFPIPPRNTERIRKDRKREREREREIPN